MKKSVLTLGIALLGFVTASSLDAQAAYDETLDHDIGYEFRVGAFNSNSNTSLRERTTTNIRNT